MDEGIKIVFYLEEDMIDLRTEQLNKPVSWFIDNVKCCRNCHNWMRDIALMGDYAFNVCKAIEKPYMTAWDSYCKEYKGTAKQENLVMTLDWNQIMSK